MENGEEPLEGLSPGVEFAASAVGLIIVVIQVATIRWAAQGAEQEVEETAAEASETEAEAAARTESPLNNAE